MLKLKRSIFYFTIIFSLLYLLNCGDHAKYFTLEDFYKVEKIDAHVHNNSLNPAFIEQAKADNFKLLTINVDYPDFIPFSEQQNVALTHRKENADRIAYASTFAMSGWDEQDWQEKTIQHVDDTIAKDAIAVKVWKNIGMDFRDKNGKLVMLDDPKFDAIFHHLSQQNIPVIGHLGEPRNCWLPVEEMTVKNEKEYFKTHPQYHMYLHPEFPSYEEQMAARDRMLDKNKQLRFMGAHLASLEWSIDEVAKFLDRYPNAVVDMAARIMHLQYQSQQHREAVRDFMIKYQDRILYATDATQNPEIDPNEFKNEVHETWLKDWQYLVTADTLTTDEFDGVFLGLALPKKVVEKMYRINAEKMFPEAWK